MEYPRLDLLRQLVGYPNAQAMVRELRERHGAPWLCYGVEGGSWLFGLRDPDTGKDVRIFGIEEQRLGRADLGEAKRLARELLTEMNDRIAEHVLRMAGEKADPIRREAKAEREAAANAWLREEARRRWGDTQEADSLRIDYGRGRG